MKIGYYVQGDADEAFVWGLAQRWCPHATLAEGKFRGASRQSFRREIRKALLDLKDNETCDILVVLTDADVNRWRDVQKRESQKIPLQCQDITVFGVADRNIECWLAINRQALANELACRADEIPRDDPSGFVKRKFGLGERDVGREMAKERVRDFVASVQLKYWIENSDSFEDFYKQVRRLSRQNNCRVPNELDNP